MQNFLKASNFALWYKNRCCWLGTLSCQISCSCRILIWVLHLSNRLRILNFSSALSGSIYIINVCKHVVCFSWVLVSAASTTFSPWTWPKSRSVNIATQWRHPALRRTAVMAAVRNVCDMHSVFEVFVHVCVELALHQAAKTYQLTYQLTAFAVLVHAMPLMYLEYLSMFVYASMSMTLNQMLTQASWNIIRHAVLILSP